MNERIQVQRRRDSSREPSTLRHAKNPADLVHNTLFSGGRRLDTTTRATLEPRFGHSFADVRVHSDASAAESAAALGARAYTIGSSIVFDAEQYAPETSEGQLLLAHELTHVVQQRGASGYLSPEMYISQPGHPAEVEAHSTANQVMAGMPVHIQVTTAPAVQRWSWDDNPLASAGNWLGDQAYHLVNDNKDATGANPAISAGVDDAKAGATGIGTLQKIANAATTQMVPNEADELIAQESSLLGKNSAMSSTLSVAGVGLNVAGNLASGQGVGESLSGAGGSFLGSKVLPSAGPVDTAINVANTALKAGGAPQGVTDATSLVADATASSFGSAIFSNLGRGAYNAATGDTKALDKQFDDIASGKSGAALQGYALMPQLIAGVASGEGFDKTLTQVASQGQNSSAGRVGSWLGDQASKLDASIHGADDPISNPSENYRKTWGYRLAQWLDD